jgi:hypothetical protein
VADIFKVGVVNPEYGAADIFNHVVPPSVLTCH